MNKKSQELELRNVMQGLEEFATFMSYQSNYEGLRILSVETAESSFPQSGHRSTTIIPFRPKEEVTESIESPQTIHKKLQIKDRIFH